MDYVLCFMIILFYNVKCVLSDAMCSEKSYTYGYHYFYCSYGCCGTTYNRYCCSYYRGGRTTLSGGVSAAIGVCVICFFIAVIIAALCYKKKYHGRVLRTGTVGPHAMNTVHVTHTTTTVAAAPGPQPYPMYGPPAYPQGHMRPAPGAPMFAAPAQQGYVPPPPAYSAPPPEYGVPPPSYSQAQNFPTGKY